MQTTIEWAVNNIRLPKGAKWDFQDRKWQLDIINDQSKKIVCRKPTQVGMSTVFLIKMLHFADENTCRLLYTLPRQDDVYDMVNSRLHDIISESPYISSAISEIDNVRMKKFKKSWLHFIEMSVPPRMLDADWMLNDEVDLSNQQFLQQAISRLDASQIGVHHQISTPTIDGFGIDALYALSDQKQWFVKCGYCNHEQVMTWELNLEVHRGEVFYKCARCGNKIYPEDIRDGRWIATGDTSNEISGYQISQLMVPSLTPRKLYNEWRTIERKTFFNYRLGLPYTPSSAAFDREHISTKCVSSDIKRETHRMSDEAVYVLGCDQGNVLHYCVMKVHKEHSEIVLVGTTEDFDYIGQIARLFNIRYAVLDALPNHHTAMQLANDFPVKFRLAYFGNVDKIYNVKENRVYINKTDAYDMLLQRFVDVGILFYAEGSQLSPEVNTAIAHICNMRRDIETQTSRIGGTLSFHTWKCVGPDHYADAVLYAMIASDMAVSRGRLEIYELDIASSSSAQKYRNIYAAQNGIADELVPIFPHLKDSEMRIVNTGLADANPYVNKRKRLKV